MSSHPTKKLEMKNGKPVPCREWCYEGVVGRPTPANPPKYPEEGCMGHKVGGPCMIGRDKKPRYFVHPNQPEWKQVPGVADSMKAVESAEPEWRQGSFAVVKQDTRKRGTLIVPEMKDLTKPRSPLRLALKEGELSWGDYAYYQDHPDQYAKYGNGRVIPELIFKSKQRTRKNRK